MRTPNHEDSVQNADSDASDRVVIRNLTRNTEIAHRAEIARSGAKRTKGLLGRKGLDRGEGMWIIPCEAVHTFFMQFSIDLIYLDRDQRVKKTRSTVRPWRISGCLSAYSVLEVPVGTICATKTQAGDVLEFLEGY